MRSQIMDPLDSWGHSERALPKPKIFFTRSRWLVWLLSGAISLFLALPADILTEIFVVVSFFLSCLVPCVCSSRLLLALLLILKPQSLSLASFLLTVSPSPYIFANPNHPCWSGLGVNE